MGVDRELGDYGEQEEEIMASSDKETLRARFVGRPLGEVPTPSAVLDLAKVEANCERMLSAVTRLGIGWRPHIKTHKVYPATQATSLGNLRPAPSLWPC